MDAIAFALVAAMAIAGPIPPAPARDAAAPAAPRDGALAFTAAALDGEPRIDGSLDDEAWIGATPVPLIVETAPGDNLPARVATTCYLAVAHARLFLGCRAIEPDLGRIRAYVTDRDNTQDQDRIILLVDTFNDARRAYRFSVNALGVQEDGVFDEQKSETDTSWDTAWRSAGRLSAEGYTIEAAIPLAALRYRDTEAPQTWGFMLVREQPRSDRVELRPAPLDRANSCLLCQSSKLQDIVATSPGRNLELVPSIAIGREDVRGGDGAGLVPGAIDGAGSFDLRWGVSSNLTLNATVNPDFSQVESDTPQLSANARFALMFPEKRAFFLEGADFFSTPIRAVFTRSIADPSFGLKLTGKLGANVIGLMAADDEVNRVLFPGSQGSASGTLPGGARTLVARLRRDVGASYTVGAIYAGRRGTGYLNDVAGLDAYLKPSKPVTVRAQLLASQTEYPDTLVAARRQPPGRFTGLGFASALSYETRRWMAGSNVRFMGRDFRADSGFVPQVDQRFVNGWLLRRFWGGRDAWFTKISVAPGVWRSDTAAGAPLTHGAWMELLYEGPLQTSIAVVPNRWREWYEGTGFDMRNVWTSVSVQPTSALGFSIVTVLGDILDSANARKAANLRVEPSVRVRIGRAADLQLGHSRQRLSSGGREIFTDQFTRLRVAYNFTPRAFVRTVVQFGGTTRDPRLYRSPVAFEDTSAGSQIVFAYRVDPQTAVFLGYGDAREGTVDATAVRAPLATTGRTFFLKLGYAWRP